MASLKVQGKLSVEEKKILEEEFQRNPINKIMDKTETEEEEEEEEKEMVDDDEILQQKSEKSNS